MENINNNRLKILLTNAISLLEENLSFGEQDCINEIGITHNEYIEIMGEQE